MATSMPGSPACVPGIELADAIGNLQGRLVGVATRGHDPRAVGALARGARRHRRRDRGRGRIRARAVARRAAARPGGTRELLGGRLGRRRATRDADGLARRPAAPVEAELRAVALRLAVARGRPTEAAALDARLAVLAPAIGDAEGAAAVRVARAEAAIAAGDPQAAWALFEAQLAARAAGIESGPSAAWLAALAIGAEVEVALDARGTGDAVAAAEALRRVASSSRSCAGRPGRAGGRWGPLADALLAHVEAEAARLDEDADQARRRMGGGRERLGRDRPAVLRRRSRGTGSPRRAWPTGSRGRRSARPCGPPPPRRGAWARHRCWTGSGASPAWRGSSCATAADADDAGRARGATRAAAERVRPAGDARPHAAGARDPAPGRRGVVERPDRGRSRDQREHGVGPRVEHPREARRREPGRGRGARAPAAASWRPSPTSPRPGEPGAARSARVHADPGSRTRPAPLLHGTGRGDGNVRWWIRRLRA